MAPHANNPPCACLQTIHFIRHGEGFHNVAGRADHDAYKSWDYLDAHLTDFGWEQVGLRVGVGGRGLPSWYAMPPAGRLLEFACRTNNAAGPQGAAPHPGDVPGC